MGFYRLLNRDGLNISAKAGTETRTTGNNGRTTTVTT